MYRVARDLAPLSRRCAADQKQARHLRGGPTGSPIWVSRASGYLVDEERHADVADPGGQGAGRGVVLGVLPHLTHPLVEAELQLPPRTLTGPPTHTHTHIRPTVPLSISGRLYFGASGPAHKWPRRCAQRAEYCALSIGIRRVQPSRAQTPHPRPCLPSNRPGWLSRSSYVDNDE